MKYKQSSPSQSTLPASTHTYTTIFASDEKKLEFKSALKQENRVHKLREVAPKAPRLELKVYISVFSKHFEM